MSEKHKPSEDSDQTHSGYSRMKSLLHADKEDFDETARMRRLI